MPDPLVRVVVIGGGFAGLSAAVALADAGVRVTVIEGRNGLGGRARSFTDPATGEVVDNGQHLLLAGYHRTLAFLERLGTRDRVVFQDRLRVGFVEPGKKEVVLDCPRAPAPWHLLLGLLRMGAIAVGEKLRLRSVWAELKETGTETAETAEQWLTRLGQGQRSRRLFWDPLTIAALNERPETASAAGLKQVLRTMMLGPWPDARLGMAAVGLSDLYAEQARAVIEEKGGLVLTHRPAVGIAQEGEEATGVRLADGETIEADAVLCAVPPSSLKQLLPSQAADERLQRFLASCRSSPIVSANLWLDRPVTEDLFVALIGCRFQWLFNKAAILRRAGVQAGYVSLIMSAAHGFIEQTNEELARVAMEELRACFPAAGEARVTRWQVVREREATVSLTPEMEPLRPGPATRIRNLFLAGDWTATGLPATIESAVVSGERAAEAVLGAAPLKLASAGLGG